MRRAITAIAASSAMFVLAPGATASGGGAAYAPAPETEAPTTATIVDGRARAPRGAPRVVRRVITAANRLTRKRYRWGGGHRDFSLGLDRGYDCSGAVSYALYGGRLLTSPLDSTGLGRFGGRGRGRWISIYANRSHVYLVVAGLRFDTGARDALSTPPGSGPRWSATARSPRGFRVRHPAGL